MVALSVADGRVTGEEGFLRVVLWLLAGQPGVPAEPGAGEIVGELKRRGYTIVMVEQNFHFAATVADRHYIVEHGTVVDMLENDKLAANKSKLEAYLGV